MDPMDFTMDSGQPNQQQAMAHQFQQCQQQQQQGQQTFTFTPSDYLGQRVAPPPRESQHYDPVHDSSTFYQRPLPNTHGRPSYPPPQTRTPWPDQSYAPGRSWQPFGDSPSTAQFSDSSSLFTPSQTSPYHGRGNTSWAESRGHDRGVAFNHPIYLDGTFGGNNGRQEQTSNN